MTVGNEGVVFPSRWNQCGDQAPHHQQDPNENSYQYPHVEEEHLLLTHRFASWILLVTMTTNKKIRLIVVGVIVIDQEGKDTTTGAFTRLVAISPIVHRHESRMI